MSCVHDQNPKLCGYCQAEKREAWAILRYGKHVEDWPDDETIDEEYEKALRQKYDGE